MRLGILGGSFDPIHLGHLKIAEFCQKELKLDFILFIPAGNPPHKSVFVDYQHRFAMVKLAIKEHKNFRISDIEKSSSSPTYTLNTLKKTKKLYPNDEIFFFIGEDNVSEIQSWYDYKELFHYAKFVVLSRNVESRKSFKYLNYFDKLHFLNMPEIDISSSMIRNNLAKNLSIDGFVPKVVENYIRKNKLYRKGER